MKTKTLIANVALALSLGVFYSCDKKAEDLIDTDTSSATDNAAAENAASEMFKSVSEVADNDAGLRTASCYTVTVSGLSFPKTVTIDFGTVGCDNKRGQIIAVLSGPYRTAGSTATITTNNFYVGTNKVDAGTHVITNMGNNVNNKQTLSVSVSGAVITTLSGGTATWNATRTITWEEGDATPTDPTDDVYSISGQTNGTSVAGVTYTSATTAGKPLVIKVGCQYISSGEVSLTPHNKPTRTIDFGAATTPAVCGDNQATVKIGSGAPINITL